LLPTDATLLEKFGKEMLVAMNYNNYEKVIVESFGVELKNFPGGVVLQPGMLPRPALKSLVLALDNHDPAISCHWVIMDADVLVARKASNTIWAANGEEVYKPRKKAARRTVKKKTTGRSLSQVPTTDEDD